MKILMKIINQNLLLNLTFTVRHINNQTTCSRTHEFGEQSLQVITRARGYRKSSLSQVILYRVPLLNLR